MGRVYSRGGLNIWPTTYMLAWSRPWHIRSPGKQSNVCKRSVYYVNQQQAIARGRRMRGPVARRYTGSPRWAANMLLFLRSIIRRWGELRRNQSLVPQACPLPRNHSVARLHRCWVRAFDNSHPFIELAAWHVVVGTENMHVHSMYVPASGSPQRSWFRNRSLISRLEGHLSYIVFRGRCAFLHRL